MAAPNVEGDEPIAAERGDDYDAYGVGRLLAFSDGVFAIAITLLVLSIPVPNLPPDTPDLNARLIAALRGLSGYLGGFALSFVLVGAHWMIHHRLLRRITHVERPLMWINLLILLGICLVPFATSLLVRYGETPAGAIVYAALQVGISLSYFALRTLLAEEGTGTRTSALLALVQVAGFAASIPVALVNVEVAYAFWLAGFFLARVIEGWAGATRR
jgi:TMEM175 potassium channel family protein